MSISHDKELVFAFSASKGWFENFKKRAKLHSIKYQGELASEDEEAAQRWPAKFTTIIRDQG
ncbi:hypothetical protein ENBRE01_2550 [Enteropsectra breve]|nr:hypothetical protein ENBRE01_2550 [Enteropsectra breve]